MATEADISVPASGTRAELGEQDRNIVDQATITTNSKLPQEERTRADEVHSKPLTLEGGNFLEPPSASEVLSEIDITLPEASKAAENPGQTAKDDHEILIKKLNSGDQSFALAVNEETSSEGIQKKDEELNVSDKDGGTSIEPMVEYNKSDNLNVQVNTGDDRTKDEEKTEDIQFNVHHDVPKEEECQQSKQKKITVEQEQLGNERESEGSKESSIFVKTKTDASGGSGELQGNCDSQGDADIEHKTFEDRFTDHSNPKVTEKTKNSSLVQVDGSHMEWDQQLEKENDKLRMTEVSTGSIIAVESSANSNIRDEDKDLKKTELFKIEKNTSALLKEELHLEKPIMSLHTEPEDTTKASDSSHENTETSSQGGQNTGAELQGIKRGDTEEKTFDATEIQDEDIESSPTSHSNSHEVGVIAVDQQEDTSNRKDECFIIEAGPQKDAPKNVSKEEIENVLIGVDGSQVQTELCQNEKYKESTLQKIESTLEKDEHTLQQVASEEIKASNLVQEIGTSSHEEHSLTADPKGILHEQSHAATKEETIEDVATFDSHQKNEDDLLIHFDGSQMKEQDHFEKESEKSPPFIQDDSTVNTNDELGLKEEVNIQNENHREELFEREKNTESAAIMDEDTEETGKSLNTPPEYTKPSNLVHAETSCFEEQNLSENQQAILDDKTEGRTTDAEATNQTPQKLQKNAAINVANEDNGSKNSLIQVDASQMRHEAHLEKETKNPSTEASSKAQTKNADPEELSTDKIMEELTQTAETREESTKDLTINIPSPKDEDTSPIAEDGSKPSMGEVSTCRYSDNEPVMSEAKFEDDSSLKTELVENEERMQKELDKPSTEALIEKQIQAVDPQEISPEKTKEEEITEVAGIKEESNKDITKSTPSQENEDTSPIAEDRSELSLQEVSICKGKDDETATAIEAKVEDDSSQNAELVKNEKYTEKELSKPLTEASTAEQIQTIDPQEISPDKTQEEITDIAGAKEENTKDLGINVSSQENEGNSPIAEAGLQEPSLKEASMCKYSDNELANTLEAKFEDGFSLNAEMVGNDKGKPSTEASREKQIQTVDSQEISPDKIKEEIIEVASTRVENTKDIAINDPNQENEDTSPEAEYVSQKPSQEEVPICKASENEPAHTLETKFEDGISLRAEFVKNDKCTEKEIDRSLTEASSEKQTHTEEPEEITSDRTKENISGVTDRKEESTKGIAINVPSQENESEDGSQEPSLKEASMCNASDDEPSNTVEAKFEEDPLNAANEISTEKKIVEEVASIVIMYVGDEDNKEIASGQDRETTFPEQHCLIPNPQVVINCNTEDKTNKGTAILETPEVENVKTAILHEDTEEKPPIQKHSSKMNYPAHFEKEREYSFLTGDTTESTLVSEAQVAKSNDYMQVSIDDIKESSGQDIETRTNEGQILTTGLQEISGDENEEKTIDADYKNETNAEGNKTNVSNEDDQEISQFGVDGSQKPSLKEASMGDNDDDKSLVEHEANYVEEVTKVPNMIKDEENIERNLEIEEVSIESSQEPGEDITTAASVKEKKASHLEEQSVATNTRGITGDHKDYKTINEAALNAETSENKDVETTVEHEDTEEGLQTQADAGGLNAEMSRDKDIETTVEHEDTEEGLPTQADAEQYEHLEKGIERNLAIQEVSIESLQEPGKDNTASAWVKEKEASHLEERSIETNTQGIIGDHKEDKTVYAFNLNVGTPEVEVKGHEDDKTIDAADLNAEKSKYKDVDTTVEHENTEEGLLIQADAERYEHLEKGIEHNLATEEVSIESLQEPGEDITAAALVKEKEASHLEEQSIATNTQGIIGDHKEDKTVNAADLNAEMSEDKTNSPTGENEVESPDKADGLQNSSQTEVSVGNTKEDYSSLMHEAKFEDKDTIIEELNERSTDGTLRKEVESFDLLQAVPKYDVACASVQVHEKPSSLEEESLEMNPENFIYNLKEDQKLEKMELKAEAPETKNFGMAIPQELLHETSLIQMDLSQKEQRKHLEKENDNPSLKEPPKDDIKMLKEEPEVKFTDSSQVLNEEMSPTEEQIFARDLPDISCAITDEATEDIATDVPRLPSEDKLHVELDTSQKLSLEETLKSNDDGESSAHVNNTLQEGRKVKSILVKTDQNATDVTEDATKDTCIEQLAEYDTTKGLLGDQKHTEGQEGRECRQEKALLDATEEDVKETTSTLVPNDFLPKSSETSGIHHSSGKELTIDREELLARTGNDEEIKIDGDQDKGEEASKQNILDSNHDSLTTTEVREENITGLLSEAPEGDSPLKIPVHGQEIESINVEETSPSTSQCGRDEYKPTSSMVVETSNSNEVVREHAQNKNGFESETQDLENIAQYESCDIMSKAEETIEEEEKIKAAAEIHNDEVLSEDNFSKKNQDEDENMDHRLGWCKEEVAKDFEGVSGKHGEEPEVNLLENESFDRSLNQNELETRIESSEEANQAECLHVETGNEDLKEDTITDNQPDNEVKREEINTAGIYKSNKDTDQIEKVTRASEESMTESEDPALEAEENSSANAHRNLHQKEVAMNTEEVPTIVNTEVICEEDTVHTKTEDSREKVSKVFEDIAEKAEEECEENLLANVDKSLHQIELDNSIKEVTTEVHKVDHINTERRIEDSKEEIATESHPGEEVKEKDINTREICDVKQNRTETEKEDKGSAEAIKEAEEGNIANVSIDRSLHQEELAKNINKITTIVDAEKAYRVDHVCLETKPKNPKGEIIAESYPEEQQQEMNEKDICEVKEIADETMKETKVNEEAMQELKEDISANKYIDSSLHQEEPKKSVKEATVDGEEAHGPNHVYPQTNNQDSREKILSETRGAYDVKQQEENEKEICEVKAIVDEALKVSRGFEEVSEKAVQESENNLFANVDRTLQQNEPEKCTQQVTTVFSNEELHGEDNVYTTKTTTENLVGKEIDSPLEETCKAKNATEIEKIHKGFQENAEGDACDLEENLRANVDRSPQQKEQHKSVQEVATTLNTEEVQEVIDVHKGNMTEGSLEKAIEESHPEDEASSDLENVADKAVQEPANGIKVSDDFEKVSGKVVQEPEELGQGVEVATATLDTEEAHAVHPKHIKNGFEESKEDVTRSIANRTHSDEVMNECAEEQYPIKGTESQISTVGEDIDLFEKGSSPTITATIPETVGKSDPHGILESTEVGNQQEEEVSKRKGMAESVTLVEQPAEILTSKAIQEDTAETSLEAEDQLLNLHDLPQESRGHGFEKKTEQTDGLVDLQNVRDISVDVQKLTEFSIGMSIEDNPVQADLNGNIYPGVSSDGQEAKAIHSLAVPEVTSVPAKDKQVVQVVDQSKNVSPQDTTGNKYITDIQYVDSAEYSQSEGEILKPSNFKQDQEKCKPEESASQDTTKSMQTSDLKEIEKPSLSDLFQETAKQTMQMADDPVTLKEPTPSKYDQQTEQNDNDEHLHNHAKSGEEKGGDEESNEKRRLDMICDAPPVIVDAGDAEVKVAHKKSHNILSGVGSKVKHSISKVKKAITGKSSHHPKPSSPK